MDESYTKLELMLKESDKKWEKNISRIEGKLEEIKGLLQEILKNGLTTTMTVTSTEKHHVTNDYEKILSVGYTESEKVVASSLACMVDSKSSMGCENSTTNFQPCPLLNRTYCPASKIDLTIQHNKFIGEK